MPIDNCHFIVGGNAVEGNIDAMLSFLCLQNFQISKIELLFFIFKTLKHSLSDLSTSLLLLDFAIFLTSAIVLSIFEFFLIENTLIGLFVVSILFPWFGLSVRPLRSVT